MFSREEVKRLKEQFWTSFGQYVSAIPSADLEKVNWVNYKTGVKHLYFRMDATNRDAIIMIELTHPDDSIRELMFAQFEELKNVFQSTVQEDWVWENTHYDDFGKKTSRISISIDKVSIFKKEDWPSLVSFFKPRILALDEFWSTAKYAFDIFK